MKKLGILLTSLSTLGSAYANPIGIIGGQATDDTAYAALVLSNGGTLLTVDLNLPATSVIGGVAMNSAGISLIGGQDLNGNGYTALISPDGVVTLCDISPPQEGTIGSTVINSSGQGLIAGSIWFADTSYAGYIVDGIVNQYNLTDVEFTYSVALNDDGVGLIGGEGLAMYPEPPLPYAAYVDLSGNIKPITGIALELGSINTVAINAQGNGIIGGSVDGIGYAALVFPGTSPTFTSLNPPVGYVVNGVAINNSGLGLIGGVDVDDNAYAAYVSGLTVNPNLISPLFSGEIEAVAINSSGAGLIGGQNGVNCYARLVQSNGSLIPISVEGIAGLVDEVAINEAGVGLIGSSSGYAALVAPDGSLTPLNTSGESIIYSVALGAGVLNEVIPQAIGPFASSIYTQLAASSALETRFIQRNRLWHQSSGSEIACNDLSLFSRRKPACVEEVVLKPAKPNAFWVAPFGDFVHLKAQGSVPSYRNNIGGALIGYDREFNNGLVGAAAGYAFNYIKYGDNLGHGKLQEEMLSFYGAYYTDHFWLDGAVWGGLYQFWNTRNTLSLATSKASTHGWILSPHLEMASPWAIDQKDLYWVEPFFMLDWVNNWQGGFTESGSSGLNVRMGSLYNSLLQSEAGLRFYERFEYGWGNFYLEEKLSYVNQAPFHFNTATTSFVSSVSSFPIAVGSSKVENLGSVQVIGSFVPKDRSYPFGGFALQTTANGSYQSYFVSLFCGLDF